LGCPKNSSSNSQNRTGTINKIDNIFDFLRQKKKNQNKEKKRSKQKEKEIKTNGEEKHTDTSNKNNAMAPKYCV
jgi:putative protein kinase ArgK-like GTPase of G3E family